MERFPTYKSHEEVACFHCGTATDTASVRDDGSPDGHGRYSQGCLRCGMRTWYDVPSPRDACRTMSRV